MEPFSFSGARDTEAARLLAFRLDLKTIMHQIRALMAKCVLVLTGAY